MTFASRRKGWIAYAERFPDAWIDFPWGEAAAKVKSKVFVFFGQESLVEESLVLCVKLPETRLGLLGQAFAEPAGYGLGKSGWVMLKFARGETPPPDDWFEAWIEESYRAVAPKTLVKRLDEEGLTAKTKVRAKKVAEKKAAGRTKVRAVKKKAGRSSVRVGKKKKSTPAAKKAITSRSRRTTTVAKSKKARRSSKRS